mmetsp:Transcript_36973/g.102739  ORF Transcript_36973/g.102739 Transcript_36973/m.102739 type:complete len:728 (-) Transcript_36973:186-2369(-)
MPTPRPKVSRLPVALLVSVAAVVTNLAAGSRSAHRSSTLPVTKVVQLLQEMQNDLEQEYKEDEDTFKELSCWCKTNEQEKKTAIEAARQQIEALEAKIEASSGMSGELSVTLEQLKRAIAENEEALATATVIRQKEAADFHVQEKELLESVQLLHGAITALAKHQQAMLQEAARTDSSLSTLKPALRRLVHRNLRLLGWLQTSEKRGALLAFLDAHADLLDPDPEPRALLLQQSAAALRMAAEPYEYGHYQAYSPRSGEIFGILRQMKESFEADLPEIQHEEIRKQTMFAELRGSKTSEIAQLKEQLKSKKAELASAKEELAVAKRDLEDTKGSLSADQRFLLELTGKCIDGENEWERRSKLRTSEIQAISEAIKTLTTDEVRDAQQTTFGFLQLAATRLPGSSEAAWRKRAAALLGSISIASPEVAALLATTQTDPFAKVVEAIDSLIAKLKTQQADEVERRDFCISELHENSVQTDRKTAAFNILEAKIAHLASKSQALSAEISELKREMASLQVELQRASLQRRAQNVEFQKTVADQTKMHAALEAAYSRLAAFYLAHETLLQQAPLGADNGDGAELGPGRAVTAAPEFQEYQEHSTSNHVMTLIKKLAGEAKALVDASIHDEQSAQAAYEGLVAETNAATKAKSRMVTDKTEELASVEERRRQASADKGLISQDLASLANTEAALQQQCNFLLDSFGARQEARAAEMDGLAEVKAILRGMRGS